MYYIYIYFLYLTKGFQHTVALNASLLTPTLWKIFIFLHWKPLRAFFFCSNWSHLFCEFIIWDVDIIMIWEWDSLGSVLARGVSPLLTGCTHSFLSLSFCSCTFPSTLLCLFTHTLMLSLCITFFTKAPLTWTPSKPYCSASIVPLATHNILLVMTTACIINLKRKSCLYTFLYFVFYNSHQNLITLGESILCSL